MTLPVMEINFIPLDVKNASDEDFKSFLIFRRKYHEATTPEDPLEPDEKFIQNIRISLENPEFDINIFGITSKDKPDEYIGFFNYGWFKSTSPSYETNKHLAVIEIQVLPESRKQGIAKQALHEFVKAITEKSDIKFAFGNTEEVDGREFAKHIGAIEAQVNVDNRLYLDEVDWSMVKQWNDEGRKRNPETTFTFYEEIPEEIMTAYVRTYQETINQIPRDEMALGDIKYTPELIRKNEDERRRMGRKKIGIVSIEPNGEVSGVSELGYNPATAVRIGQGLTSVLEQYRGRGLGKILKAALLLKAREQFPDAKYIGTDNATSNGPMLHINKKLGFMKHKERVALQIPINQLQEYLQQ